MRRWLPEGKEGIYGDVWTWTAIDAETKLVPCWLVGARELEHAESFMVDLAGRLANRVQLTSDGLKVYLSAVDTAFNGNVDFSQLVKVYGGPEKPNTKYTPPECVGSKKEWVTGQPDVIRLRSDKRPDFINLDAFARKIPHHFVLVRAAGCAKIDEQFRHRILACSRHTDR